METQLTFIAAGWTIADLTSPSKKDRAIGKKQNVLSNGRMIIKMPLTRSII
jgi:hypothetical protein